MSTFTRFGEAIKTKRISEGIPLRDIAETLNLSCPYLSDIEHGKRLPLREGYKFDTLLQILKFSKEEQDKLYYLAKLERGELPQKDIDIFLNYPSAIEFIKVAISKGYTDVDFKTLAEILDVK